ncbi:tyrosine-type recombinase/integrase, partial [Streptomyces asiaticus]
YAEKIGAPIRCGVEVTSVRKPPGRPGFRHRHQLGTHCLRLTTDSDHGSWTFAVDLPSPDHHRATIRRGGFPTQDAARSALRRMLEGEAGGFTADPNQTVADYLATWLEAKAYVLKPTTVARYRDYVTHDLIPALGALKLDELGHRHIAAYAHTQLESGRGPVTVHRCLATLSSALGDAVRQHRLAHNPARPAVIPRPAAPERTIPGETRPEGPVRIADGVLDTFIAEAAEGAGVTETA